MHRIESTERASREPRHDAVRAAGRLRRRRCAVERGRGRHGGRSQSGAPGGSTRSAASVVPANVDASKYYKARAALPTAANSASQCGDSVCSQEGFDDELRAWWPLTKKEIVEKYLELRPGIKWGWRATPAAGRSRSLIPSRNVSRRHRRVHHAGGRTHGLLCGGLPGRCAAGPSRSGRI